MTSLDTAVSTTTADYDEDDWEKGAAHDFQYGGLSYKEIGEKYGNRDRTTIQKLVKRLGIERVVPLDNRGGRPAYEGRAALSPTHRAIGVRINLKRTLDLKITLSEFAVTLSSNRSRLRDMELGVHDYTLTELRRIASVLGTTVTELLDAR